MPNAPSPRLETLTEETSAKFTKVLEHIRTLDKEDMRVYGTKYKHFLFTDIRESQHGVKALASFMISAGFDFRMQHQPKQIRRGGKIVNTKGGETAFVEKPPVTGGSDSFAILQSFPLWKNTLSVKTKKDILRTFNSRPENAHGELLRIVALDSKFKEGIDLFDVKYVHILEPAIANSDMKQAVGRATRFCGQKGLHFIPKRGWPLEVFVYTTLLPNRSPFHQPSEEIQTDAHALMLAHSGLDLALMNLTKELTVLAITTAVDYDLNFAVNNFDIQSALVESTDVDDIIAEIDDYRIAEEAEIAEIASLASKGGRVKLVAVHSPQDITPAHMERCRKRSSKLFPFTKQQLRQVATRMGIHVPTRAKREWFCEHLKNTPGYLEEMLKPISPNRWSIRAVDGLTPITIQNTPESASASESESSTASTTSSTATEARPLFPSPRKPSDFSSVPSIQRLFETHNIRSDVRNTLSQLTKLPFSEFQKGIVALYETYKWKSPIVKNGCEQIHASSPGKPVSFTQTQDFVRHYLTPASPFKGLLAWHSVGTGKTCMAIASATTEFEKAGYNILWVTRNSLMADVYKNMFGTVCSIPLMERIKEGWKIPDTLPEQKRLLSKLWFAPISYKTFQNALEKRNELGRMLHANSPDDPLRKTFLIMDEVHKLQDGDLGPAESADFPTIQRFIHTSYESSGKDSVRPLLMTATPITDTPAELFAILNTLISNPTKRLMPFPEFRTNYTSEEGVISPEGISYFQERAKGLISYLNREYDPSTFSQPAIHVVPVPIHDTFMNPIVSLVEKCIPPKIQEEETENDYERKRVEIESTTSPKEAKRMLAKLKQEYARTKRANAKTRKLRIQKAKRCYREEKKRFTKSKKSQLGEIESCFEKEQRQSFVSLKDFLEEVER